MIEELIVSFVDKENNGTKPLRRLYIHDKSVVGHLNIIPNHHGLLLDIRQKILKEA